MRLLRWAGILLLAAGFAGPADALQADCRGPGSIGTALMAADGTITLTLNSGGAQAALAYRRGDPNYARILSHIGGLQPGSSHGFHIHEKGDCSAADGSSAGGHFNPAAQPHGRAGHGAHHAGDADNLVADANGVARVDAHVDGVTLGGGAANDIAGRAIVVHAAADDYSSQPAGNAGARVACGVIRVTR